jgi:hypothetical protein
MANFNKFVKNKQDRKSESEEQSERERENRCQFQNWYKKFTLILLFKNKVLVSQYFEKSILI